MCVLKWALGNVVCPQISESVQISREDGETQCKKSSSKRAHGVHLPLLIVIIIIYYYWLWKYLLLLPQLQPTQWKSNKSITILDFSVSFTATLWSFVVNAKRKLILKAKMAAGSSERPFICIPSDYRSWTRHSDPRHTIFTSPRTGVEGQPESFLQPGLRPQDRALCHAV